MATRNKIELVKNCDKYGCVPACLAMISGIDYERVKEDFYQNFDEDGLGDKEIIQWLGDQGYFVIQKRLRCYNNRNDGREELLKPFAPIHLLEVKHYVDSKHTHVVVMDAKGKLYCPSASPDEEVRNSYMVLSIMGIY